MSSALAFAAPQPQKSSRPVSHPHDRDEREAERAAEVVASGGSVAGWSFSSLQRPNGDAPVRRCAGPGKCSCPACRARVDDVVAGGGSPLDTTTRSFMEAAFGHDFGRVRLHADSGAAQSARALGARAYTLGNDVVTAEGVPDVCSAPSRRLLAHELTHVVQDGGRGGEPQVVHRQAAPGAPAPAAAPAAPVPARPAREERFNIGRGGHVDAVLDRAVGWLTVRMKVLFNFVDTIKKWPSKARQDKWQNEYVATVAKRWSFKHFLVPEKACPGEPQQVPVSVQVVPVTANPHYTLDIRYTDDPMTSSAGGGQATMDVLDVERRGDVPQVPAEHEFGHMLGLPHIHCDDDKSECYGINREEKADVMGKGSFVSPRDYEPLAELMQVFTGCVYRVKQASFIPTSRGPGIGGAIGGLLGGLGGLIGGAALGMALGPIGAIVGGLLGLAAGGGLGFLAGRALGTPEVPS